MSATCSKTKKIIIKVDKRYYRPTEVDYLLGDSSKAKKELGWEPKINIELGIKKTISWWKNNIK